MLNVCLMLTFLKCRSLWLHVFFLIFSVVLVVKTLNAGQGQRHPSAEPQLRTAQADLRGPRPRRAASEGYALSPVWCFSPSSPPSFHPSFWPTRQDYDDSQILRCSELIVLFICAFIGSFSIPTFPFDLVPPVCHIGILMLLFCFFFVSVLENV